ncbi:MAG: DegV family protein [Bacteroidales bacterium]|nr:DegV family protein [Bacteroidales bacterium]
MKLAGDIESIVESLKKDIGQAKIFVSVRDIKSMIRGGRVSRPKGLIASALGLNPVISMDDNGKSLLFGKTFSQAGEPEQNLQPHKKA